MSSRGSSPHTTSFRMGGGTSFHDHSGSTGGTSHFVRSDVIASLSELQGPSDVTNSYLIPVQNPAIEGTKNLPDNYIRTTKYTKWNFLPKNLLEQFRRVSNFYFLTVVIVQLIPGITPLLPITSIIPLVFVLGITALKEAIEDYSRHKVDVTYNAKMYECMVDGKIVEVASHTLRSGMIVRVLEGQEFPSDLILLSSSHADGSCYIETSNLDGETNLKVRRAVPLTAGYARVEAMAALSGILECEAPNEHLYHFYGRFTVLTGDEDNTAIALSHVQLLQRGSVLRNTDWVFGIVAYAGIDTKLFLNQQEAPSKFSMVEKKLNFFILYIFAFQMTLCIGCALASAVFEDREGEGMWYIGEAQYSFAVMVVRNFLTYFVLFNTMIPISLWVTLELVRVGQALFMEWDAEMYGTKAKTSNLNEDLGTIDHVFTDKTGTLTQNKMVFHKCLVGEEIYRENLVEAKLSLFHNGASAGDGDGGGSGSGSGSDDDNTRSNASTMYSSEAGCLLQALRTETRAEQLKMIRMFATVMSVCHSVVPGRMNAETGQYTYQAQSPDEAALVKAAARNGYRFVKRTVDSITVDVQGEREELKLEAVMEFTAQRRRMSVVVRRADGSLLLLTKGADLVVFDRIASSEAERAARMKVSVKEFSSLGYRTLVFAFRELSEDIFEQWHMAYYQASIALHNREKLVEQCYSTLERNLVPCGVSAIEDKLQVEVPETINFFLRSQVHVWVLTGDMQETAVKIGFSCKLLSDATEICYVNCENSPQTGTALQEIYNEHCRPHKNQRREKPLALIIDGHSINFALHDYLELFLKIGRLSSAVICCRITPLQKALIVASVKKHLGSITLAIGDGANDMSMIQEAHVGVGIYGEEGTQAARVADYAIHEFRDLKRLMMVHGRYSYLRITGLVLYSFYKNVAFTFGQFIFSFMNGFTGQTLYDSWIVTLFNIFFTSVPPFLYGLFEADVSEELAMRWPVLYNNLRMSVQFNGWRMATWFFNAIYHSVFVVFLVFLTVDDSVVHGSGRAIGLWDMGVAASVYLIVVVNVRLAIEMRLWNIFSALGLWLVSVAGVFVFMAVYSSLSNWDPPHMYGVMGIVSSSGVFWMALLLALAVTILPDLSLMAVKMLVRPDAVQIMRERDRAERRSGAVQSLRGGDGGDGGDSDDDDDELTMAPATGGIVLAQ